MSAKHTGWRRNATSLGINYAGDEVATVNGDGINILTGEGLTVDSGATLTVASGGALVLAAGSSLTLPTGQATGYINLPLASWRVADAAGTNYGLLAATAAIGSGGVGGADASPALIRVNAGTDKTVRIVYADAVVKPILNDFQIPFDFDPAGAASFKVLAGMSGTNNATTVLTLVWVAVGAGAYAAGSNQGSASTAFAATANLVEKSFTITPAAINAPGNHVSVELTPDSPGTDAMHIYGTWVEYTKKLV
jgi:hypothetical protein